MENLEIGISKDTPQIDFNFESGILKITGASYPENTSTFYNPVVDWIITMFENNDKNVELHIKLSYFNTSSSKALLDIFELFEQKYKKGHKVAVKWYYRIDHESIFESGEEYAEDFQFPFELIEYCIPK